MRNQLTIADIAASNPNFRIFGPALLPKDVPWPKDANDKAMLLFVSFPLVEIVKYKDADPSLICNVFITYDPVNCNHLYAGLLDESCDSPIAGAAFILCNEKESKIQKRRVVDVPKEIRQNVITEDEPYWLQDEIAIDGMSCAFQLSATSIAAHYSQLDSVFGDEEYYFFLPDKIGTEPFVGRVLVQMT